MLLGTFGGEGGTSAVTVQIKLAEKGEGVPETKDTVITALPGVSGAMKVAVRPCSAQTILPMLASQWMFILAGICPFKVSAICSPILIWQGLGKMLALTEELPFGVQA
jgi:hypothetical protein